MLANRLNSRALIPFQSLSRELDRMFEGIVDAPGRSLQSYPPVSIWEDDEAFHLEAEVPGISADELDVSVLANRVTLSGERKERTRGGARVHREEWTACKFERTFELPLDVDANKIKAELDQGLLRLTLPKAPQHKAVRVEVRPAKNGK